MAINLVVTPFGESGSYQSRRSSTLTRNRSRNAPGAPLSRLDTPYVYLAFSYEANAWASGVDELYLAKIGRAGGSSTAPLDRVGSLSLGYHKGNRDKPPETWSKLSDGLLGACDWDMDVICLVDTGDWAKSLETALRNTSFNEGLSRFEVEKARPLIKAGMSSNGVNDVVRATPEWLRTYCPDFEPALQRGSGNYAAREVLDVVRQAFHDLIKTLLHEVGAVGGPGGVIPKFTATMIESPTGTVQLWEGGASLMVRSEQG